MLRKRKSLRKCDSGQGFDWKLIVVAIVLIVIIVFALPSLIRHDDTKEMADYYFQATVGSPCGDGLFGKPEVIGEVEDVVSNAINLMGSVSGSDKVEKIGKAFFKIQKNALIIRISLYTIWNIDELKVGEYKPGEDICETVSELALLQILWVLGPQGSLAYATFEVAMIVATGTSPTGWIIEQVSPIVDDTIRELTTFPEKLDHFLRDNIAELFF